MSWILDIVVIVIFALTVLAGLKNGFIDSVIGFVGLLAALVVAFLASSVVADGVYTAFVEKPVQSAIVETIEDAAADTGASMQEKLQKAEEALPGFVKSLMEKNGVSLTSLADKAETGVQNTGEQIAVAITEKVVRPAMTLLIRCIAFILLFVVLMILCGFLGKIIGKIIKHSPFKGPDKLLGGVLGAVKGALWVLLVVTVMQMTAGFTADDALISKKSIEDSTVVGWVADVNPIYSENNIIIKEFNNLFDK